MKMLVAEVPVSEATAALTVLEMLLETGIKYQHAIITYLNSPLCVSLCLTTTEPEGGEVRTMARADVAKDNNKREAIANIVSLS